MPVKFMAQVAQFVTREIGSRSNCVTSVPHAIISMAINTGASTGPHHGNGSRKRMSQSNSECGQPHITFRKT